MTPPSVEQVEHMCALLTACSDLPFPPSALPNSLSTCVRSFAQTLASPDALKFSLAIRDCAEVSSCADLRSCTLRGAAPDECTGWGKSETVGRCDLDGRAITCLHEKVIGVRECPRGGEQCSVRDGQADCVLGPCLAALPEGAPATCSPRGHRILKCEKGKLRSIDCTVFGLTCTVEDGRAGCAPQTGACDDAEAGRCDGEVAVGCMHGREVRVDCGAAGLTCNAGTGDVAVGSCREPPPARDGDRCDPKEPPRCDGTTITYCFAGRRRTYNCRETGFDSCVQDGRVARCQ